MQTIAEVNVLVKNGLGLEEFLDNTVKSAQNSKLIEVNAIQKVQPLGEISPVVRPGEATADAMQSQNHGR
ncbi:Zinc ABC transporter, substrate-binding protein ZnuA [uncultured Synechococcales cyanobacterium]|uniref:Zinc ABC transporter, substrate-binding protein ZnuA n=1 Tax=uncultured Synechococcales cyanobacterium TaxID=1936017 RepID=A0A6J4VB59_9CYAN|nr:Zinc ABC transporter, substrate-binding protein ZnuA [uncultured Synechococcales cyanobacterium]